MVKVIIENEGRRKAFEGDLSVGTVVTVLDAETTESRCFLMGTCNPEILPRILASMAVSTILEANEDPFLALLALSVLQEEIRKTIEKKMRALTERLALRSKECGGKGGNDELF